MKKSVALIASVVLLAGCGGDSSNDGSIGPSAEGYSRISNYAYSDSSYHDSVEIEVVKSYYPRGGTAVDIVLSEDGRTAYIATGSFGLEVVDVTNPESPVRIDSIELPEYVNHVEISNGRLYLANQQNLQSYRNVYAFDIHGQSVNYAGSSQGNQGVGHENVTQGEYLYQVSREGLQIYRDTSGGSYDLAGSHYLHGTAYAVAVRNNYVFVANGSTDGLTILKTDINGMVGHVHAD